MIKLLSRFRISHKLLVSSLAFSLPIALLLYFVIDGFNTNIDFTNKEIIGDRLLKPVQHIITLVPEHKRLISLKALGDDVNNELSLIEKKIDSALIEMTYLADLYQYDLKITETELKEHNLSHISPKNISKQWNNLLNNIKVLPEREVKIQYDAYIDTLTALIRHIGDASNLILDPDLDSYYLMDISMLVMPVQQKRLSEVLYQGIKIKTRELNSTDIKFLENFIEIIEKENLSRISRGVSVSVDRKSVV